MPIAHARQGGSALVRLRAGLGGGRALDLDALDLVRRDLVDGKTGRHALAVDQDLREAAAHAAHAQLAAGDVDARQALEHVAELGVAVLVQLVAAVELLGDGLAAQNHVLIYQRLLAGQGCDDTLELDDDSVKFLVVRLGWRVQRGLVLHLH